VDSCLCLLGEGEVSAVHVWHVLGWPLLLH
jgi:hypothetical protein